MDITDVLKVTNISLPECHNSSGTTVCCQITFTPDNKKSLTIKETVRMKTEDMLRDMLGLIVRWTGDKCFQKNTRNVP